MAEIRGDTDTTIDVEGMASSIKVTTSQYELFMPPERCIFRTPTALQRHNEKAYIPYAFSIGPLHHDSPNCPNCPNYPNCPNCPNYPNCPNCPNFKDTETIKAKYLEGLISRSEVSLEEYINCIGKELEREAREYYAVPIGHSPEEFVKILVIDGCFIIELFWRNIYSGYFRKKKDPIFSMSSMVEVLYHDLILLENQVPWKVLEHLFSQSKSRKAPTLNETLIRLAINFFCGIFPFMVTDHSSDDPNLIEIKHIPDLFKKWMASSMEVDEENSQSESGWGLVHSYTLLVECGTESSSSSDKIDEKEDSLSKGELRIKKKKKGQLIPSATRLVEAGIKFSQGSTGSNKIFFRNGVLQIPPITINGATETLFRNLISFEQCHPNSDDRITSYAVLLDSLINTDKDVEILSKNKILDNWLNPEDAAQLFNKLYHDTCIRTYSYENLGKKVNKYCKKRWPRWRAVFAGKYFNTPWAGLSTSAAVILLILTLVQTWYTIKC